MKYFYTGKMPIKFSFTYCHLLFTTTLWDHYNSRLQSKTIKGAKDHLGNKSPLEFEVGLGYLVGLLRKGHMQHLNLHVLQYYCHVEITQLMVKGFHKSFKFFVLD